MILVGAVSSSGEVREVYRARVRLPIVEEMGERLRTMYAAYSAPPPPEALETALRRLMGEVGDPLPAWQAVLRDPSGRLWLELPACPLLEGDRSYEVVDTCGRLLGTITMPAGLTIRAVREDRVLAVRRDDLGVEHLELYRILH